MRIYIRLVICLNLVFGLNTYADDDCKGHSCNDGGETVVNTAVDNVIGGNSSRGYAFSGSDVDIAQCYRSYQILIWQDSKINPLCLADSYDSKGLHAMAAIIRCDVRAIRKHFKSDSACIVANTVRIISEPMAEPVNDDDDIAHLYALVSDLEEQRAKDADIARKARVAAQQAPKTIIQQQEFINESKRAKLAALRGEK